MWRGVTNQEEVNVALTDMKRPGGVRVKDRRFGERGSLDKTPKSFEDSLQLSKYAYATKVRYISLTDLQSSLAIRLGDDPHINYQFAYLHLLLFHIFRRS